MRRRGLRQWWCKTISQLRPPSNFLQTSVNPSSSFILLQFGLKKPMRCIKHFAVSKHSQRAARRMVYCLTQSRWTTPDRGSLRPSSNHSRTCSIPSSACIRKGSKAILASIGSLVMAIKSRSPVWTMLLQIQSSSKGKIRMFSKNTPLQPVFTLKRTTNKPCISSFKRRAFSSK